MLTTNCISGIRQTAAALAVAVSFIAVPAAAGGLYQEHVLADSFGNLIIYSPAGYKRIVVGQGHLAEALETAQAEVARPDHHHRYHDNDGHTHYHGHCNRQPVLLHGRSYMYGLPDHVVPVPAGICY